MRGSILALAIVAGLAVVWLAVLVVPSAARYWKINRM
jgi:hypothetical protein